MKPIFHLLLLYSILFFQSCNECQKVRCPDDIEISECQTDLFPYVVGDKVSFVGINNDTLVFECYERVTSQENTSFHELVIDECCQVVATDFKCSFSNNNGSKMFLSSSNVRSKGLAEAYIKIDSTHLRDQWFLPQNCQNSIFKDTVILGGYEFHNIFLDTESDSVIFIAPNMGGLIGFRINGKEWRKIN